MSVLRITAAAFALVATGTATAEAQDRDAIAIAGSSTVLPYATIVAEAFGENFDFPKPDVQSGGSSAGLKQFCEGVGANELDIANASRPIKDGERETCAQNGVSEIIEVRIGYDGIVFASQTDGPAYDAFTPAQWYYALAAQLPQEGEMVDNPNSTWSEAAEMAESGESLPDEEIVAFIPGTKHGTREVFEENVILAGCAASGAMEQIMEINGGDEDAAEETCMTIADDGRAVDIDGDYTETLSRIESNPTGIGVFGLAFYENNTDKLKVATMGGVEPNTETISRGEYPVSRPLFFYLKKAHLGDVPGLKEFAIFFVSEEIAGQGGPLAEYGLVPDPELAETRKSIEAEQTMGESS